VQRRNAPLLERPPIIPQVKALLSRDGGVCPEDGTLLIFDPWSPDAHTCPRCGKKWSGVRHHRHWARYQHLWVAERAAELATVVSLTEDASGGARAREILQAYGARYFSYPNRDNVLGPSRLFFSTYIESLWILNYLAAAMVLRAANALDEPTEHAVNQVADEAANLIGEFDERFSNRQTWNNTALVAIAAWFGDAELAQRAISGQTGLAAHLMYGFRPDGLWYEGENYHLFALRGLVTGTIWAKVFGVDFTADARLEERLAAALLAPALTALPDFTFPARKDSRFGVSLAQPMYLETWEVGLTLLEQGAGGRDQRLTAWLKALYATPGARLQLFESYLHDAPYDPRPHVPTAPGRSGLSWWGLLGMMPELPGTEQGWRPGSVLLADQGLAVLRSGGGDRYASLEAGIWGGGHGHPDRLNLTLHAGGTHWLPDPGTGSYVSQALFWYRSTLAHNAPRLDGRSQTPGRAVCEMFDEAEEWAWARGRFGDLARTLVAGPHYLIDVLELTGRDDGLLELPWHFVGETEVASGGKWVAGELQDDFVSEVARLERPREGPVVLKASHGDRRLVAHLLFDGELLRATAPGLPGSAEPAGPATFYVTRTRGRNVRFVTVLEPGGDLVRDVRAAGDEVEVNTRDGVDVHRATSDGWTVETTAGRTTLRGPREIPEDYEPLIELEPPERARGVALRLDGPPALDATANGFDASEPLTIDIEDQYRRSEEPYQGPEDFAARALAGWDEDALYLAVDVVKPDLVFRAADAPPLRLDNEPDDIHSDGLQIYIGNPEGDGLAGVIVIPESGGGLRVRAAGGTATDPSAVRGAWQATESGYRVTLAFTWPEWLRPHVGARIGFDLIINEMLPDRERRAGQLAWSGGNGWVWLRGDRQSWERLGELELVG